MNQVARRPVAERLRRWLIARCAPISIDGQTVQNITIDGQDVREVTMDGDVVFEDSATPDSAVDTFEEYLYEDKGNSLSDYYTGDLSNFQRQQNVVFEGNYALECSTDSNVAIISNEGNGLPNYLSAGDTLEAMVRIGSGSRRMFTHIRAYNSGGGYQIDDSYRCRFSGDSIGILGISGQSSFNGSDSTTVNGSEETWYKQIIQWQTDDTIVYSLEDTNGNQLGQVSIQDSTHDYGGVGLTVETDGSGETFYWDDLRVV